MCEPIVPVSTEPASEKRDLSLLLCQLNPKNPERRIMPENMGIHT